jgi:hypothetical protein
MRQSCRFARRRRHRARRGSDSPGFPPIPPDSPGLPRRSIGMERRVKRRSRSNRNASRGPALPRPFACFPRQNAARILQNAAANVQNAPANLSNAATNRRMTAPFCRMTQPFFSFLPPFCRGKEGFFIVIIASCLEQLTPRTDPPASVPVVRASSPPCTMHARATSPRRTSVRYHRERTGFFNRSTVPLYPIFPQMHHIARTALTARTTAIVTP